MSKTTWETVTFPKLWALVNAVMGKFGQNQGKERTGWKKRNAERRKAELQGQTWSAGCLLHPDPRPWGRRESDWERHGHRLPSLRIPHAHRKCTATVPEGRTLKSSKSWLLTSYWCDNWWTLFYMHDGKKSGSNIWGEHPKKPKLVNEWRALQRDHYV